ncbi:hypothetical protein LIER_41648 [Lithospermum erythrorhizon]|uniref:Uncharacterized protein n=1 Tax=Lithospermum erythrorhizon TaxID=34254 RepID=A0AAV3RCA5_LITER
MNSSGNDNHPHEDDVLNLNNLVAGRNEDAPLNPQGPIHIGTYVGRVWQDKNDYSLMTIRQRKNEAISFFQDRFQTEFNLVPGANQKIEVIAFIEGLRMSKFKESLMKKNTSSLEEVNERANKYIRIEKAEKRAEKEQGKRPVEESHRRSPNPKRRSALDRIRTPNRG